MKYRDLSAELDQFEKDWLENQTDEKSYSIVKLTLIAMRHKCEYLYNQYKLDEIDRQEKRQLQKRINSYRRYTKIGVLDNTDYLTKSDSD